MAKLELSIFPQPKKKRKLEKSKDQCELHHLHTFVSQNAKQFKGDLKVP
jgi:hypothetical protein